MGGIRRVIGMLLMTLWATGAAWGQAAELQLLRRIPIRDLAPLPEAMLEGRKGTSGDMASDFEEYGFIKGGKALYLGHQGWAYDLEKDEVFRLLNDAFVLGITADGKEMLIETRNKEVLWQDSEGHRTPGPRGATVGGVTYIHPGGQAVLSWCEFGDKQVHAGPGPELLSLTFFSKDGSASMGIPVNVPKDRRTWIDDTVGFTGDGKYLIVAPYLDESIPYRFVDLNSKRFIPVETMGNVFNRDASLVAGKLPANDWSSFVWDRTGQRFLWKDPMISEPSAFSPNGQFLYCCDTINGAYTGKTVFENIKGFRGKFSPDGRSLVTVDDDAFYIYTLPKDSEPIFGVFQKPEPWSPTRLTKRTTSSTKKPLKKP